PILRRPESNSAAISGPPNTILRARSIPSSRKNPLSIPSRSWRPHRSVGTPYSIAIFMIRETARSCFASAGRRVVAAMARGDSGCVDGRVALPLHRQKIADPKHSCTTPNQMDREREGPLDVRVGQGSMFITMHGVTREQARLRLFVG